MKLISIVGARPQFVKAAVISREIAIYNKKNPDNNIEEIIIHTGQHYDNNMSKIFFKEMQIPEPQYNLGICDCSHGAMTGRMLENIEVILKSVMPNAVLVYGDTNSTLAGALAASKLHLPVAHIEAGLRSFNRRMPEETNRVVTDHLSDFLFCPTETSVKNLHSEGIGSISNCFEKLPLVLNTGDVMLDAVNFYSRTGKSQINLRYFLDAAYDGYYLTTIHREENTNNKTCLKNIFAALRSIAKKRQVILPLHPRTKKFVSMFNINTNGISVIDPVGYFDLLNLLRHSKAVFTDSGGLQKEAYFFQKPCITLREETEWTELVEHGFNILTGANKNAIISAEKSFDSKKLDYSGNLYGNGHAGMAIIETLGKYLF
ncbi:MAG: UDP-N-acetylglucosamine 2-epimerase (non-hydrolyzing) [Actinomycetota bacterium]|nr:UDP-N-acetylglucosamine 2-epimerase (non-hydrolyzing) [Actinomycetota bacterium]